MVWNHSGMEISRADLCSKSLLLCEGLRVGDRDGEGKPGYQEVAGAEERSGGNGKNRKWSELGCI